MGQDIGSMCQRPRGEDALSYKHVTQARCKYAQHCIFPSISVEENGLSISHLLTEPLKLRVTEMRDAVPPTREETDVVLFEHTYVKNCYRRILGV